MNMTVVQDQNGLNMEIGSKILSDADMHKAGFTSHEEGRWYFVKTIAPETTLNINIPMNGDRLRVDVIDEDCGQPYDYQRIKCEFASKVERAVNIELKRLSDAGIITGFAWGMYV